MKFENFLKLLILILILFVLASFNLKAQTIETAPFYVKNYCVSSIKYGVWDDKGNLIKTIKIKGGGTKVINLPIDRWFYAECIVKSKIDKNISNESAPHFEDKDALIPTTRSSKGNCFMLKHGYGFMLHVGCTTPKA